MRLDRLLELRLAKEITSEDYSAKKSALEQEKINLKGVLDTIDERIDVWINKVEDALSFTEHARKEFEIAINEKSAEKKKKIFTVLGYNHLLKDKILNIQTENQILAVKEASILSKTIYSKLEPPKTIEKQQRIKQKYASSSLLCGIGESNACQRIGNPLFYH